GPVAGNPRAGRRGLHRCGGGSIPSATGSSGHGVAVAPRQGGSVRVRCVHGPTRSKAGRQDGAIPSEGAFTREPAVAADVALVRSPCDGGAGDRRACRLCATSFRLFEAPRARSPSRRARARRARLEMRADRLQENAMTKQVRDAYIVAALRTPVGKAPRGMFRHVRPDDMLAHVLKGVLAQVPTLDPHEIADVIVGCAMPEAEQGMNVARIG